MAVASTHADSERLVIRQVFEAWSIELPASFVETFNERDGYWHAYDAHRSVSLTSMVIEDGDEPVRAEAIVHILPPVSGEALHELPPGMLGWAVMGDAIQPARASRCLSALAVVDGRVLMTTITSDDEQWARQTWMSIRHHPPHLAKTVLKGP